MFSKVTRGCRKMRTGDRVVLAMTSVIIHLWIQCYITSQIFTCLHQQKVLVCFYTISHKTLELEWYH